VRSPLFWPTSPPRSKRSATTSTSSERRGQAKLPLGRARDLKPDQLEAKREQALIQSTAAKLIMTRHRVEEMRAALVERDKSQAEIGEATVAVREQLAIATGLKAGGSSRPLSTISATSKTRV